MTVQTHCEDRDMQQNVIKMWRGMKPKQHRAL